MVEAVLTCLQVAERRQQRWGLGGTVQMDAGDPRGRTAAGSSGGKSVCQPRPLQLEADLWEPATEARQTGPTHINYAQLKAQFLYFNIRQSKRC